MPAEVSVQSAAPEVRYRPVQPDDIAALSLLLPAVLAGDWSEAALQQLLAGSHSLRVLQRVTEPELVGFAEFLSVVDECQLYNIAVLPKWQRRGLGRVLLQQVLGEAQAAGLQQCVLEVRESNTAARALYESAGFRVSGRRKDYYPPLPPATTREAALLYGCLLGGSSD